MPSLFTRSFLLLTAAQLLQALGYASMILLPLYRDFLGADRAQVGMIMAVSAVGGLSARPAIAWGLDRWGRKPTLVVGTFIVVSCFVALGAVDSLGPLVYGIRLVMGIGLAALFTGYFTLASDLVPPSRRAEGLALFGIAGLIPLVVNPLAGRIGFAASELRWFFPIVGVGILCSLILLAAVEAPPLVGARTPLVWRDVLRALRARPLWPVWFATGVFAALVSVFMSFTTIVAESRGLVDPAVAWFSYAGGAVMVRALGASLPERVGLSRILAPALAAYVMAMGMVAIADTTGGFLAAGALAGFGHGYCFPVLTAQTVSRSPEALRGTALSLYTALWDLAKLAVVPAMGLLADWRGDETMLWTCCAFGAAGGFFWAFLEWRTVIPDTTDNRSSDALP